MTTFAPTSSKEVVSAIQWAAAEELPIELVGQGSKRGIGRPSQTEHTLDLSKLRGVTLYEPAELVMTAKAGTSLAEVEKLLAENGQQFDFEPMDYGPLHGLPKGQGTIGGVLAANLSGPRRLKAGAARDHVLGIEAVSGHGEVFKSGGRVVKNVTGYDMSKLLAGSWGTLAALTSVTFKVLPAAETETTVVILGLEDEKAAAAMALAMGSSAEVSSAAHLPEGITGKVAFGTLGNGAVTLLRLEGFPPSIAYRRDLLHGLLKNAGVIEELTGEASFNLWRDIRDCSPFVDGTDKPVWRVSVPPADSHAMTLALRQSVPASLFYDWQGGLVWLRMEDGEPHAEELRAAIQRHGGGHATLVRASPAVRAATPVFEPSETALAALAQRLKAEFDPKGILNPGRMG
jgi:glycolate oxidase FAD binding subunit